ncbi:MAG TPA: hypothetical protein VFK50_07075 [Sphingomicrobium sp.]|nr:hypothetical protein [Sphingomicrobium sp.]
MSAPLRFLGLIAVGWLAFRAGTLWSLPGAGAAKAADDAPESAPSPIVPTEFPPIAPAPTDPDDAYFYPPPYQQGYPGYGPPPYAPYAAPVPVRFPVYYPAYHPVQPTPAATPLPDRRSIDFDRAPLAPPDDWSLVQLSPMPGRPRAVSSPVVSPPLPPARLDRLQLSSWALLRGRSAGSTLASGGTLGGGQAGARLTYAFDRRLAAQIRTSSPVGGGRGVEVAVGARYQPLRSIPVWINAERRQAIGDYGRSAFALFAEGGLYEQHLPWKFQLDAYIQGGLVGISRRDLFVDGGLTATRPLFRNYSVGAGLWGGAQPGVYRIDVGPRLSMKVSDNIRIHADWRQRLAGKADPGSGPALTLAADF